MDEEARKLLAIIEMAHPLWTMYIGQPKTGEPIQISKEAVDLIKRGLVRLQETDNG
jgi:hypothetical protein